MTDNDNRTEGWGSLADTAKAHYFRNGRSLCGGWMAWGHPQWESNQARGARPDSGTCTRCWKRAPEVAP